MWNTIVRATVSSVIAVFLILGVVPPTSNASPLPIAHRAPLRARPIVSPLARYAVSPPLRALAKTPANSGGQQVIPLRHGIALPTGKPNGLKAPVQPRVAPRMPATSSNFAGISVTGYIPPDPNGAVGPQDYVQTVNASFAVFNKDPSRGPVGALRYGPAALNTLWSGVGGLCETVNGGDPIVVYDSIANRWVISQLAFSNTSTTYFECIAISTGGDPTGSYYRYVASYSNLNDYPKMAVWPDAYYVTYNLFQSPTSSTFLGVLACAFDRNAMLSGAAASQVCFQSGTSEFSLLPSALDGSRLPPTGSPNYLVELGTTTSLVLWKFHVDFVTPSSSTFTGSSIGVATFSPACNAWSAGGGTCIPQPGTAQQLDSLGERLMYRLAYRNFGSYESLVVDHAVTAGSSVGMRWYEIRSPGSTPTLYQEGTYAPDTSYRWMGSIAEDRLGDMAMGFSLSSNTTYPSIGITGRLAGDPLGTLPQGESTVTAGNGSQTGSFYPSRWGDYTSMTVDPADDCTFWYTNEYLPSNGDPNWRTSIASFAFPGCLGSELVQNGGFESGTANWAEFSYRGQQPIFASPLAHSGSEAFLPCGYAACDDRVSQTITVPATVSSAKLRYWLRSFSSLGMLPGAPCLDRFSATLATPDGTVISGATLAPLCEDVAVSGYVQETVDVTSLLQAHTGQQLVLMLRGTTANLTGDSATFTQWSVDDVSLVVS